jgi:peptidoglycan hydrolase-like protein with peptidoglycan-binding domain
VAPAPVIAPARATPSLTGVKGLQARLGVAVDGDFGPLTEAAVVQFQRAHGLTPDGIVDAATRAALGLGPGPVLKEVGAPALVTPTPTANPTTTTTGGSSIGTPAPASTTAATEVSEMIAAANQIATLPYIYGGGHASFTSDGYDCSGSVSYVLHAAGLLSSPEDSSELESYGAPGPGRYVTIYATDGHAWMTIDGRRFDTVALAETGTRWASGGGEFSGYVVRHPVGL